MAGGGGESGAYLIKLRNYATMKFKDFDWLKKVTFPDNMIGPVSA